MQASKEMAIRELKNGSELEHEISKTQNLRTLEMGLNGHFMFKSTGNFLMPQRQVETNAFAARRRVTVDFKQPPVAIQDRLFHVK